MIKKRILLLMLLLVLALVMAACGGGATEQEPAGEVEEPTPAELEPTEVEEPVEAEEPAEEEVAQEDVPAEADVTGIQPIRIAVVMPSTTTDLASPPFQMPSELDGRWRTEEGDTIVQFFGTTIESIQSVVELDGRGPFDVEGAQHTQINALGVESLNGAVRQHTERVHDPTLCWRRDRR